MLIDLRLVLLGLYCYCTGYVHAADYEISQQNLQKHVRYLSSKSLAGRLTGSVGEQLATQYVADYFKRLNLEPAGDNNTFFQTFDFVAGVYLGKNNSLTLNKQKFSTNLILNKDWYPLPFSDSLSFKNVELIFAGYGISVLKKPSLFDSYHGLNVKGKWVIVLKNLPEKISPSLKHRLILYSSLRYKAFLAKSKGAKGIIFVSNSNSKLNDKLPGLSQHINALGSGFAALSVKQSVINELLRQSNYPEYTLQNILHRLEHSAFPPLNLLKGVNISGQIEIKKTIKQGCNVLARLKMGASSQGMIVLGAHVDHLGHGEFGNSRAKNYDVGRIHPGADDNASGVSALLESAAKLQYLKTKKRLVGNKDILFAAWSGEEIGILGSSYYVQKRVKPLPASIEAAINLDMIGHLKKHILLQGVDSARGWARLVDEVKTDHSIPVLTQSDPYLPTDSTSFYLAGVPTLNFFSGGHEYYHTPQDTADSLNYKGIKIISDFLVDLIQAIEARPNVLVYQKLPKKTANHQRSFKLYLGTIPDYADNLISGVRLSGVSKDSPAEKAGIQQNDVVLKLAGTIIHDIYDYTYALNMLTAGKPAQMTILRNHKKINVSIVAQYRD